MPPEALKLDIVELDICQHPTRNGSICGLSAGAVVHRVGMGHTFAGVAQSAERLPRKQEVHWSNSGLQLHTSDM